MSHYIHFANDDGSATLIEVDTTEVAAAPGVVKAGIGKKPGEAVAEASALFETALGTIVRHNAEVLIGAVAGMSRPPDEAEIGFGVKATGEVGNFAIAKVGGEANYNIRLLWKRTDTNR